ncbi:MAG TPA: hypothetical protein VIC61_09350 [Gammaproteobacteria bacterium]|jgi:hypothetical protein
MRHIISLCAFLLSIGGCATVTTGTTQAITVETTPPGATCKLMREGQLIAAVNPTPGSATIGKDKDEIEINCEKDGFLPTSQSLTSTFQGATLGNILLGGIIGVFIDAGSGAANKYPTSLMITLVPESFASMDERDRYFDDLVTGLNTRFEEMAKDKKVACDLDSCKSKKKKLDSEREVQVSRIEAMRSAAVVAAGECDSSATC